MTPEPDAIIIHLPPETWRGAGLPPAWSPAGDHAPARVFSVRPLADGWCVQGDGVEPLLFRRGGHAEHQARALAEAFARLGHNARITVYDRRNRLAGAIDYFGGTAPPPTPARAYPWAH